MLVHLITKKRNSGFFLFPVILAAIWLNHLIHPTLFPGNRGEEECALFSFIFGVLPENLFVRSLTAIALVALSALLIFHIYRKYLFPKSWSSLPAIFFIMASSGITGFQTLHPVWAALPFLGVATSTLFSSFDLRKPYKKMFNTGLLLGLGSLFWFHLIILLPAFLIGARLMARDARWRESVMVILGSLLPWIGALSTAFMTDTLGEMTAIIGRLITEPFPKFSLQFPEVVFTGFMAMLTLTGSYTLLRIYDQEKISFRRFYIFFFLLFISCFFGYLFIPGVTLAIVIVAAFPVTFLLSSHFELIRVKFLREIAFLAILGLVIYIQLT